MRNVLVTGATQGIGNAVAAAIVQHCDEVIVHGRADAAKAGRACADIGAARAVTADLREKGAAAALYALTGPVDCLILNASVQYKERWEDIAEETLEEQIDVNIKSTLRLMQLYYPAMKANGFGRIVTIGSVNQRRCHPELSLYAATKCAVMSLVRNIAKEAAPYGVTVNNVSPGAIDTPRNSAALSDRAFYEKVRASIPMGRIGRPEDCAGAVLFLCGDGGAYITGADIAVDGGMGL